MARYTGNVLAKTTTGTVSTQQFDIYLKEAEAGPASHHRLRRGKPVQQKGPIAAGLGCSPARSITWSRPEEWW